MTKKELREFALSQTLFPAGTLANGIENLGFVQADPIRSPARAQDLILRHRVKNYHVGDIEKFYPFLDVEEDYLYAYGYLPRNVSALLHPKKVGKLSTFDKKVLEVVSGMEEITSKSLEEYFGKETVTNWWGGKSRAAKHSLDILNYWGFIRVTRREKGQRIYANRIPLKHTLSLKERKKELILTIVKVLSPITERKLTEATHYIRRGLGETRSAVEDLVKKGELTRQNIDGINYLWVTNMHKKEVPTGLRILAPFDPIVWDRRRFEHLWGWQYRFEAYVPAHKRIRGYYAMPVLWNEDIIGWANIKKENQKLKVDLGFVNGKPNSKELDRALDEEIENLTSFLAPPVLV